MLCCVADIDVDHWKVTCQYHDGLDAASDVAVWFWITVREMSREELSAQLHFCIGSVHVPAQGFTSLVGYDCQQQRFTLSSSSNPDTG